MAWAQGVGDDFCVDFTQDLGELLPVLRRRLPQQRFHFRATRGAAYRPLSQVRVIFDKKFADRRRGRLEPIHGRMKEGRGTGPAEFFEGWRARAKGREGIIFSLSS